MDGVFFTLTLIAVGVGILIWGLYALIKEAVKDALIEFEIEKESRAAGE